MAFPCWGVVIVFTLCHVSVKMFSALPVVNTSHHLAYKSLRNDILSRDVVVNKIPPVLDVADNETEHVEAMHILLVPLDVLAINEISQVITVIVFIQFTWTHKELSWQPADHEAIESIQIDSGSIWTPRIVTYIAVDENLELKFSETLKVSHTGEVSSEKTYPISFRCEINFERYPFDTQICSLGFYPSSRPTPPLHVSPMDYDLTDVYKISGEWTLQSLQYEIVTKKSILPLANFPVYSFTLTRRSTYYVITIIFPMILTSAMIHLVFVIPTKTGEKISYLVAIFTSTAIFLNFICDVMPRGLLTVPYLAVLLVEVMVEGFLATLASLVVVTKFESEEIEIKNRNRNSGFPLRLKGGSVAPLPETKPEDEDETLDAKQHEIDKYVVKTPHLTSKKLDLLFLFSFVICQIIFLIVLFVLSDCCH